MGLRSTLSIESDPPPSRNKELQLKEPNNDVVGLVMICESTKLNIEIE